MQTRVAIAVVFGLAATVGFVAPRQSVPHTRVVVLGTGSPNADPDRSGPAVAIVIGDAVYVVDAGPGIVRRAALAARQDSIPALRNPNLQRVFLTHLHSDHTVGLPDLMLSPWVLERSVPLEVRGPPGTARMVNLLSQAYSEDIEIRLHGGEPSNKTGYATIGTDVTPGEVYRDSNVTVTAFEVLHGKWEHAYGYIFKSRDRTIVISGDTRPSDAVAQACQQCDVLIHEVYDAEAYKVRTAEWRAYHSAYHTSTYELAALASRARPKLLLLYHQGYRGGTDETLVQQIKSRYGGPVVSAHDLGVY